MSSSDERRAGEIETLAGTDQEIEELEILFIDIYQRTERGREAGSEETGRVRGGSPPPSSLFKFFRISSFATQLEI